MSHRAAAGGGPVDLLDLSGSAARHRKEAVVGNLFKGTAIASVVISAAIVLSLAGKATSWLIEADLSALWSDGWFPRRGLFDLKTIIGGTLMVTLIAMLVATPLGLGAALFLSEYARPRARRILKPVLEILASIPSVVLGVFALTWISPNIVQSLFADAGIFNVASAGLAVGILVTPLVASISEDAMRAVPMSLREASYGLGARKRTTTLNVVFPAAVSGVVASLILAASRAIGETMIVAIAAGGTGGAAPTIDPSDPGQTMTGAMTALAIGSDQVRGADNAFDSLYFVGLLLFSMTLGLNILSERFVRKVRQKY